MLTLSICSLIALLWAERTLCQMREAAFHLQHLEHYTAVSQLARVQVYAFRLCCMIADGARAATLDKK